MGACPSMTPTGPQMGSSWPWGLLKAPLWALSERTRARSFKTSQAAEFAELAQAEDTLCWHLCQEDPSRMVQGVWGTGRLCDPCSDSWGYFSTCEGGDGHFFYHGSTAGDSSHASSLFFQNSRFCPFHAECSLRRTLRRNSQRLWVQQTRNSPAPCFGHH